MKLICAFLIIFLCVEQHVQGKPLPQNERKVMVEGQVVGMQVGEISLEDVVDNPIEYDGQSYAMELTKDSKFHIEIPLGKLSSAYLTYGEESAEILLAPGDKLSITIKPDTLLFAGKGADRNILIRQAEESGLSLSQFYAFYQSDTIWSPDSYLKWATHLRQERLNYLSEYSNSLRLSQEFKDLFKADTEAAYYSGLGLFQSYYQEKKGSEVNIDWSATYVQSGNVEEYQNDAFVNSSYYIYMLNNALYFEASEIQQLHPEIDTPAAIMIVLKDSLSGRSREYVLTQYIIDQLDENTYDEETIALFDEIATEDITKQIIDKQLNKRGENLKLIGKPMNKAFYNTLLLDPHGKEVKLGEVIDSMKGQVVYLDMWSITCGPCIKAMPYAKILREKLSKLPVEFVYITVDDTEGIGWDVIQEHTQQSKAIYAFKNGYKSQLHQYLKINWVPNYIIFDKQGLLIDFAAEGPSAEVVEKAIPIEIRLRELAAK
ncbi:TlpA family protein disulfide reductase [Fulvivirga maritima]|uniref:TlpA family protein disulfide reductase n=1 Tax=Fulvivirga maritima TaxID=2904247 RepID=UPI001F1BDC1B|nr:TlpA disulfide reductase family protein [Fulvivirga maritima]UII27352.1 TlpA family protein disulfide reductase [Fulvivirga maritima]